jgi:hypothetical protein
MRWEVSSSANGGSSARERRLRSSRKVRVVAYSAGRPGVSRWPTASIHCRSSSVLTMWVDTATPRIASMSPRVSQLLVGDDRQRLHTRTRITRGLSGESHVPERPGSRFGLKASRWRPGRRVRRCDRSSFRGSGRADCERRRVRAAGRTASTAEQPATVRRRPATRPRECLRCVSNPFHFTSNSAAPRLDASGARRIESLPLHRHAPSSSACGNPRRAGIRLRFPLPA